MLCSQNPSHANEVPQFAPKPPAVEAPHVPPHPPLASDSGLSGPLQRRERNPTCLGQTWQVQKLTCSLSALHSECRNVSMPSPCNKKNKCKSPWPSTTVRLNMTEQRCSVTFITVSSSNLLVERTTAPCGARTRLPKWHRSKAPFGGATARCNAKGVARPSTA